MQLKADQSIFKQSANFWYVTGIDEAGWRLVIQKSPYREVLIAPDRDAVQVLFEGGVTAAEATKLSGVEEVVTAGDGAKLIKEIAGKATVTTGAWLHKDPHAAYDNHALNPAEARLARQLKPLFNKAVDIRPVLAKQRAIKQPVEVMEIMQAIQASVNGFRAVKTSLEGMDPASQRTTHLHEYHLEAELSAAFRRAGTSGHAYDPIVAFGKNACVLHYAKNNDQLQDGGLVLIDAGAQKNYYAADITRTYAVGVPSKRQKAVHAAVEAAHQKIIAFIRPGVALKDYVAYVDDVMREALRGLDLLREEADYRKYFPHAISHGLGLDVHESLGGYTEFMPGMILTVEPGIYIPEEAIGVRIEDDILVTPEGNQNLSASLSTAL